jgi:hypothetical protein
MMGRTQKARMAARQNFKHTRATSNPNVVIVSPYTTRNGKFKVPKNI